MTYAPSLSYLFRIFKIFFSVTFALNPGILDAAETSNDDTGNEINKTTASIPAKNLFNIFINVPPSTDFLLQVQINSSTKQFKNLFFCEACRIHSFALEHLLGKFLFPLLDIDDLLLDGSLLDKFVYCHDVLLSDTVRTVCRLVLHSNIPPWIIVDHDVRRGKV